MRRAGFIEAVAETGDKATAVAYLQQTWNDYCDLKDRVRWVVNHMAFSPPKDASKNLSLWHSQLKSALER